MSNLALLGGDKVIKKPFKNYNWNSLGDTLELISIIRKGKLSGFLAQPTDSHFGGTWVRKLEQCWANNTNNKFAISFNSWTSGLDAAVASIEIEKGSEILVPSWTMSATIASIVKNGFVPKFVDINNDTFNIDSEILGEVYSPRTQAVLAVDIFGMPCDAPKIEKFCDQNGLAFVVDAAQSPLAKNQRGTINSEHADITGFSFNRHKHLQVGEGGLAVTNTQALADKMRLIRNHWEVTHQMHGDLYDTQSVGNNYRMGEMEALLATKQTERIEQLVGDRRVFARKLISELREFHYLSGYFPSEFNSHDFYIIGFRYQEIITGVTRDLFAEALKAEGLTNIVSRYSNLHNIAAFKDYPRGLMTNTERLNNEEFIGLYICGSNLSKKEIDSTVRVFAKVTENLHELRNLNNAE